VDQAQRIHHFGRLSGCIDGSAALDPPYENDSHTAKYFFAAAGKSLTLAMNHIQQELPG